MHLQNRVTPFGELITHPGRGLVYGNRGCLHDAALLIHEVRLTYEREGLARVCDVGEAWAAATQAAYIVVLRCLRSPGYVNT